MHNFVIITLLAGQVTFLHLVIHWSGYISRSVAGSYDNEGIAIFCMLLTYALWIKSVKTGSLFWSTLCALAYFYMVSLLRFPLLITVSVYYDSGL